MKRPGLPAVLLASLLVTAACGGGNDDSADSPDDASTDESGDVTSEPTSEPEVEAAEEPETDDAEEPDPDESEPPTELTDSFRGVTADSIKIGIVIVDREVVGRDSGDVEAQWNAVIDDVNERGGILGRTIEPVFAKYSPVGDAGTEAACVKLTQDEQVFAAMGPLLSNLTCFTDVNDTIFINTIGVSQEEYDRSTAVVIGPDALPARRAELNIQALIDAGRLGDSIAVHAAVGADGEREIYVAALTDAGADVVSQTQSTIGGDDQTASEAEMQIFSQGWETDGADTVLAIGLGSGINVVAGLDRGSFRPTVVLTNSRDFGPKQYRDLGYSVDALTGALALGFRDFVDLAMTGDAGVGDCIARSEEATGETVNIKPEGDDQINLNSTIWSCQGIDIFVQVAEAAGVELTNDSFRAAAESLGELTVTGTGNASIGAGKFDVGDDPPLLLAYDPVADHFNPIG